MVSSQRLITIIRLVYFMPSQEEFTTEELTFAAHDKVDVLIDLLIEKGILTEKEYLKKLEDHYNK